jgi:hypothetical protein
MKIWQSVLSITCLIAVSAMASCGAPLTPGTQSSNTTTSGSSSTTAPTSSIGTPGKIALEKLITGADTIVVGTVTGVVSIQSDNVNIYTLVTLSVEQTIKGESSSEALIRVPGGESGGIVMTVTDYPSFKTGERALVFLVKSEDSFKVYGGYQGKFTIDNNNMVSNNQSLAEFITQIGNILAK